MRTRTIITVIFTTGLLLTGCATVGEREACVPEPLSLEGMTAFYEIIDVVNKEVWGTPNFTPEEFEELDLPVTWRKNQPRGGGWPDGGKFMRSPGCPEDGQFTYLNAFDRRFLNVVKLISMGNKADRDGLITETVLEKYHRLIFFEGKTVPVLENPEGERFIGISRDLNRTSDTFSVPEGWKLTEYELKEDLQVDLFGQVRVLRTDNEDSFQGPLPDDIELQK